MKKYLFIFLLVLNANLCMAQLDEFFYFADTYYLNHDRFKNNNIKSCKIYFDNLTEGFPSNFLLDEFEFDTLGRLVYQRMYHVMDSLAGVKIYHTYNANGQISTMAWTWLDNKETEMAKYIYDDYGKLIRVIELKKKDSKIKFRKTGYTQLIYNELGLLCYTKKKPKSDRGYFFYEYKNDTTFAYHEQREDYFTYVNGLLVQKHGYPGTATYEYDSLGQMVKFTQLSVWDRVTSTEECIYENGLMIQQNRTEYGIDDTIQKRRIYVYEKY